MKFGRLAPMTTKEVAHRLAELCRQGNYVQAIDELYADDATGHEDYMGGASMDGKAALRGGTEHWLAVNELRDNMVDAPLFFGDRFVVRFTGTMFKKDGSGEHPYEEIGLYTVKDGKIVKQEFFYDMPEM